MIFMISCINVIFRSVSLSLCIYIYFIALCFFDSDNTNPNFASVVCFYRQDIDGYDVSCICTDH